VDAELVGDGAQRLNVLLREERREKREEKLEKREEK
jgi:hypothetical protein